MKKHGEDMPTYHQAMLGTNIEEYHETTRKETNELSKNGLGPKQYLQMLIFSQVHGI